MVIPGGSGHIGTLLARAFHRDGSEVVVLSREPRSAPWRVVQWDGRTLDEWAEAIDGADLVINLAGRSVNCRYTPEHRREILDSRVDATRVVGDAIARARRPPPVWLQASTATIYAHTVDTPNDEEQGVIGGEEPDAPEHWRHSIDVAIAWEQAALEADVPGTRVVRLRSAMVMSPDLGGIFDVLLGLVRRGLGGRAGSGRQYVSWIHDEDFVRAVRWVIDHPELDEVVNLASPNPLPNADFMRVLRETAGARFGLSSTEWMLEIGAFVLRTETELVLKSRRVIPGRLLRSGFEFRYADWPAAARDLYRRWRTRAWASADRK